MEVISHDVVELILEKLPVDSLMRFRLVSKKWKSTIDSKSFQKRQLVYRQQLPNPDLLFLTFSDHGYVTKNISSLSSITSFKIPPRMKVVCSNSCDGLICLYDTSMKSSIMINPNTGWYRSLPQFNMLPLRLLYVNPLFGFGKDKFSGTYKLVWLYNASVFDNNNETICEVFDFNVGNTWRCVTPSSKYKIIPKKYPAYVDGSLYWLTVVGTKVKVLSFDLHTETFEVIMRVPFVNEDANNNNSFICNLNNSLCVTEKTLSKQVIWLLNSDKKTWNKKYSLDLYTICCSWRSLSAIMPVAVWEDKNKLLFYQRDLYRPLKIYDDKTESTDLVFASKSTGFFICCFQSLISIL